MITDAQYKELQLQVNELEKKINMLSMQMSRLILKGDVSPTISHYEKSAKKDTTKYLFEGKLYCKRRIAYLCVKKFVTENHVNKYEDAVRVFPDYLQGSLGVIKSVEEANRYSNAHRRYYFSDSDILCFDGKPYVVSSQWEKKNIGRILQVAANLGYEIESVNISHD